MRRRGVDPLGSPPRRRPDRVRPWSRPPERRSCDWSWWVSPVRFSGPPGGVRPPSAERSVALQGFCPSRASRLAPMFEASRREPTGVSPPHRSDIHPSCGQHTGFSTFGCAEPGDRVVCICRQQVRSEPPRAQGGHQMKLRRLFTVSASLFALLVVAPAAPAHAVVTNVRVQGGTTIRDSGLLDNVITPGFEAAYPQYNLQFFAVGTSAALTNAEAGNGDAVFTHNPPAEQLFVNGGYSYEQYGRAIMVSDFITVGTNGDAAGVNAAAPHDAVGAFEAIAAAAQGGNADFVSRGDGSGTQLKELQIWAFVHTAAGLSLNMNGEPG